MFFPFHRTDRFAQYDYGRAMNLKRYNSTMPPLYNLSSVQVPVTFFYGKNDLLSAVEVSDFSQILRVKVSKRAILLNGRVFFVPPQDVMRLKAQLPKMMDAVLVNNSYCNHLDFVASLKVNEHVNEPVKGVLRRTDALDWVYEGPSPSASDDSHKEANATLVRLPAPTNDGKLGPNADYLRKNLDAIMTNVVPRSVNKNDLAEFERERELQKILFRNLIGFIEMVAKETSNETWPQEHEREGDNLPG